MTTPSEPSPPLAAAPGEIASAGEARFRTLFDVAPIGILLADAESFYLDANAAACRMFGYSRDEFIGMHASNIVVAAEMRHVPIALDEIHREAQHRREWRFRRKDGSQFSADVTATKMPDGTLLWLIRDLSEGPGMPDAAERAAAAAIARDLAAMKDREREIQRLSRLYDALGQINQAIVRIPDRDALFQAVCRALVEHGGFSLAWIGWHDAASRHLKPVAEYGDENRYLHTITVYTDDRPEGRGPSATAFNTGRSYIINDLLSDPTTVPWRAEILRRGFLASAAFPIRLGGEVRGTLTVHADRRDFFHDKEIALLEEAVVDLSFALDNFARDEARRQAERTLQAEKVFSDTLIQSMPGILYLYDLSGSFRRWNQVFETTSGYSADEVARMHPRDFFSPEEWPHVEARIAEVFTNGESSVEASFLTKAGAAVPCFFTGRRVIFDNQLCLVGVGIDISARRQTEDRLAESERKYRELVEHANSIILRWDATGRITFINEFGQRFFGYTAAEIVGRLVTDTIVPPMESGGRDLERLMGDIRADPEAFEQNINENVRRNGERVWIAWTNRIVRDPRGQLIEFLSIGTDITERRRLDAERARRQQAEAADRIKSAFLATMSHELRTPLNSIIGFTGIMLQGLAGPLNPEQNKQLDMVRKSARHLLALVNDVLDISKIEAGQLDVAREPFDVQRSITNILPLVSPQADAKHLTLQVDLALDLGEAIGDLRRFEQILLNLLSNAVKFTDHGGVVLAANIIASGAQSDAPSGRRMLEVRVADTGIGIKPEDLPMLFQPFRQIDSGLARSHEGTGLGLAICRRLAELMGGEISVESVWGAGSTFRITLPLAESAAS